jgi:hypothetical protein
MTKKAQMSPAVARISGNAKTTKVALKNLNRQVNVLTSIIRRIRKRPKSQARVESTDISMPARFD